MVVDLIGIYGLKGPYRTLTTTDWFLQALSVIPRGSWGNVARRFTMIRWAVLLVQPDEGLSVLAVNRIGDYLPQSTEKSRVLVIRLEPGTSASKVFVLEHPMNDDICIVVVRIDRIPTIFLCPSAASPGGGSGSPTVIGKRKSEKQLAGPPPCTAATTMSRARHYRALAA
ncbi:hypothetical protein F511_44072 [Dorcoceras hygrometricum]|uniref:Uncharacterized protein n=1 Tax=Dorcoceras hygrometricum TaxID=472368 RepID=A0A2Z7B5J0_9LAMI|nr:hypothetical protein F511_44072 [Dorcoceras hygrometricum]